MFQFHWQICNVCFHLHWQEIIKKNSRKYCLIMTTGWEIYLATSVGWTQLNLPIETNKGFADLSQPGLHHVYKSPERLRDFFPSDYENLEYCLHYNIHFVAWPTFANIKHTYIICNVALLIVRPHVRPLCKATKTSGIWGNNVTQ